MLGAFFSPASGVDFKWGAGFREGGDGGLVEAAEVAAGANAELFWQVGMAYEIEEPTADALLVSLPIARPYFIRAVGVAADVFWVVHFPAAGEVVDAADEVVPVGHARELLDPLFVAGDVIAFEAELDVELGESGTRFLHRFDIAGQLADEHPPVVERLGHRVVVGKAQLAEAALGGDAREVHRPAIGVAAERRVSVVVGEAGKHGGGDI